MKPVSADARVVTRWILTSCAWTYEECNAARHASTIGTMRRRRGSSISSSAPPARRASRVLAARPRRRERARTSLRLKTGTGNREPGPGRFPDPEPTDPGRLAFHGELDVPADGLVRRLVRDLDGEAVITLSKRRQRHRDATGDRELGRVELRRQVARVDRLRVGLVEKLLRASLDLMKFVFKGQVWLARLIEPGVVDLEEDRKLLALLEFHVDGWNELLHTEHERPLPRVFHAHRRRQHVDLLGHQHGARVELTVVVVGYGDRGLQYARLRHEAAGRILLGRSLFIGDVDVIRAGRRHEHAM